MSQLDIAEARTKLPELLEIALNGEEVVITQGDRSVEPRDFLIRKYGFNRPTHSIIESW